ncbi:uncharacterized protein LOC141612666 [Silene latifolia]|uniref:uncharacterized protein LOC141612666 n=1 Tax=Silene latifolia TaxID=37657 RepID=UPI003D77211D
MENNNKFMSYNNMVKLDEDELECLRKLGDHRRDDNIPSKKVETRKFDNGYYSAVKLDEDELECLRKLGEHGTSTPKTVVQDQYMVASKYKMVRIDEDEIESLNTTNVVRPRTVSTRSNNNSKVPINKKLESKKSEDINESAEKFIQKFKQQLLLQRLESIENADKMLARGL